MASTRKEANTIQKRFNMAVADFLRFYKSDNDDTYS